MLVMIWYARGHSLMWGITFSLGLSAVALTVGDALLPVPSLLHGVGQGLNADIFVSSLYGIVIARCLGGPIQIMDNSGARSMGYWNFATVFLLLVPTFLISAVAIIFGNYDIPYRYVRNCLITVGISFLLLQRLGARLAATIPVVLLVVNCVAGSSVAGHPYFWAYFRFPASVNLVIFALAFTYLSVVVGSLFKPNIYGSSRFEVGSVE